MPGFLRTLVVLALGAVMSYTCGLPQWAARPDRIPLSFMDTSMETTWGVDRAGPYDDSSMYIMRNLVGPERIEVRAMNVLVWCVGSIDECLELLRDIRTDLGHTQAVVELWSSAEAFESLRGVWNYFKDALEQVKEFFFNFAASSGDSTSDQDGGNHDFDVRRLYMMVVNSRVSYRDQYPSAVMKVPLLIGYRKDGGLRLLLFPQSVPYKTKPSGIVIHAREDPSARKKRHTIIF